MVWGSCARSAGYQEGRRGPVIVNASPNFAHEGAVVEETFVMNLKEEWKANGDIEKVAPVKRE